ncbi:MAG: carbamoyltransferase [bacterium]|nr:carbamoyltransferase [bacterium]
MTSILGISAYYHDSSAALVVDGDIVAAAQEERFSRRKHDERWPGHAIDYCLAEGGLARDRLDAVVFYEKPLLKFDRILETFLAEAPRGLRPFLRGVPLWAKHRLQIAKEIRREMGPGWRGKLLFTEHHRSHAASAFFPSPFEEAAILTIDGVGEWATTTIAHGKGNQVRILREIRFPHSLGLLYSAFTYFCGFVVNSGEYKLMGLAPYGEPVWVDAIKRHLVRVEEDGSFLLNMENFNFTRGQTMTGREFEQLFGGPPRSPESPVTRREMDLAASVQVVTEEIMLKLAGEALREAGLPAGRRNLCLAGGVALNCVGNGKILRSGLVDDIWIQPAAGDAGGALGAALDVWHTFYARPRSVNAHDKMKGALLGPAWDDDAIVRAIAPFGARYQTYTDQTLPGVVADLVAGENVVGWFHGRMEFGPRALGSRSIIGDARSPKMQSVMNLKIKFRESFRPFAPCVLAERAGEWFDLDRESPYMLLVAPVREERRLRGKGDEKLTGLDRLKLIRSTVPAITHVDYSARVQTVDRARHGIFYDVIKAFEAKTGCPVIINTSFNIRGEPIVCRPEEAYRCFMLTHMDALVLGHHVLLKKDQPPMAGAEEYRRQFKLD